MQPEVHIQRLPGSTPARPDLVIFGPEPTWNRELFHAIRGLRYNLYNEVRAHELPGFAASDQLQLFLHGADSDLGLLRSDAGQTFHWHHSTGGWKQVEDQLAPFCSREHCQTATLELETQGEARLFFTNQPIEKSPSVNVQMSGWLGLRRCDQHPLESAVGLCHRCCAALCRACADVNHGLCMCAGGCRAQGELEFYPDADVQFGSVLLISSRVPASRELFHAIRSLRLGRLDIVLVHELPGFASPSLVQLALARSSVNMGVRKGAGAVAFHWGRTTAGWETVENTLALACDRYWDPNGSLDLEETGDAHVILGGDW